MVCTVCFVSCWKILARGLWNFELVQLFLDNWIADYFLSKAHVSFLSWWKFFARGTWNFELVQILLINWNWIVLLGMHGLHCLFSFAMENSCSRHLEFWACPSILGQLDCGLFRSAHMVCTACFLFRWKFLAWGTWNIELVKIFLINWN